MECGCRKARSQILHREGTLLCQRFKIKHNLSGAKAAVRLIDVVVFPTPPFWFAIAIILPIIYTFHVFFSFNYLLSSLYNIMRIDLKLYSFCFTLILF